MPILSKKRKFITLFTIIGILTAITAEAKLGTQTAINNQLTGLLISQKTSPKKVWKILPIGDSLTEGQGKEGYQSYRGHLYNLLQKGRYQVDFIGPQNKTTLAGGDPDHAGFGGYTIGPDESKFCQNCPKANIYDNLPKILSNKADVILLLIGINDLLPVKDRPVNPKDAAQKLENLVKKIKETQPQAKILVSSLLQVGWTNNEWTDYFAVNKKARELGEKSSSDKIYFVDLNKVKLEEKDFTDKLHLTDNGARKVAEGWYQALKANL
jgi:lysophospholipase L1-like esterase